MGRAQCRCPRLLPLEIAGRDDGPDGGKPEKLDIPRDEKDKADELHNELVEKAAENDEALMEMFFEKGTLNEDELRQGLKIGMMKHELFPIFCLSVMSLHAKTLEECFSHK